MNVTLVDIGPGRFSNRLKYLLNRLTRNLNAATTLVRHRKVVGRTLYTVVETGSGVVFNLTLIALARVLGYRLVLHHHSSAHIVFGRALFRLLVTIAGSGMWHVVLDDVMAGDLMRRYALARRTFVLSNAFVVPAVEPAGARAAGRDIRVGFLSNLTNEKGLDVVLGLAQQARAAGLGLSFIIGGPLSSRDAEAAATKAQAALGSCVSFVGSLYGDRKHAFFDDIDIFCFPSRYIYEAQPLVLLEAMSHGCALIVSPQGYIPSLVGDAGVVLEPQAMAEQALAVCKRWLADRDELHRYQLAARRRFTELRREAGHATDAFVAMMAQGR